MIKFVVTCLLGVSLIACQDKIRQEEDILSKPSPEENIEKDFIPFFEAEMALSEEQLKAFQVGFDELSNTTGDRSKILSPRILFEAQQWNKNEKKYDLIQVYEKGVDLLLRRVKDGKVKFFRERVQAEIIPINANGEKVGVSHRAKVRIWLPKVNPKKENSPFVFDNRNSETWHAMIIMNSDNKDRVQDGKPVAIFGEELSEKTNLGIDLERIVRFVGRNQTAGSGPSDDYTYRVARHGENVGLHSIPLISNWKELEINPDAKHSDDPRIPFDSRTKFRLAKGVGFVIKPQGLLLHYQIVANVYEGIDMRRAGVVSNVFDFQGKYLLDDESLAKAFEGKDRDGFGIPDWEGQKSALNNVIRLNMCKAPAEDYSLGFPWDMPTIFDKFEERDWRYTGGGLMSQTNTDYETSMALFFGSKPSSKYPNHVVGMPVGLTAQRPQGTYNDPPGNFPDVANHVQWAMPKKEQPSQPFTYFWISAHSAHNQEVYFGEQGGALWPAKEADKYVKFLQQKDVRSQPMVVVHQTNAKFENQLGKVPRLHAMITTDLMITELTYNMVDGKNYSVVELQNPSKLDINLKDYALVRLRYDNTKSIMGYLRSDGSSIVERLEDLVDADFYFLRDMNSTDMIHNYGPNDEQTIVSSNYSEAQYNKSFVGDYRIYYHKFEESGQRPLAPGQILLIGASGYSSLPKGRQITEPWWENFFPSSVRWSWYAGQRRFRYFAYTSTSRVLDINSDNSTEVKDGLALVKIFSDGSKKVIDTTAPIGKKYFGFSGTMESYAKEFVTPTNKNKDKNGGSSGSDLNVYYSQKRKDGVVFPFMPPYRTKKVEKNLWSDDWELLVDRYDNTLGHRWLASIDGAGELPNGNIMHLHRFRYFAKGRTPLGQPDKYMSSRPVQR